MTIERKLLRRIRPASLASARAKIKAGHRVQTAPQLQEPPSEAKCYTVWHSTSRGHSLPFDSFDAAYVERLRQGDSPTMEHFASYFGERMHLKLRSRAYSPQTVEDVRQETFTRVLTAVRDDKVRQPERFGAFVFAICKNVLRETLRPAPVLIVDVEDEQGGDIPDRRVDIFGSVAGKQTQEIVRDILAKLSQLDRCVLRDVFLDERDKDVVCRELGITRNNLRVLLCRAKKAFRKKLDG